MRYTLLTRVDFEQTGKIRLKSLKDLSEAIKDYQYINGIHISQFYCCGYNKSQDEFVMVAHCWTF